MGTGTGTGADKTASVYSYTGGGDTPDLQLTATGTIGERYLSLPGGVLYTKRYANPGGDIWALANIHGDTMATTSANGTLTGTVAVYDPYGNPINPTTGLCQAPGLVEGGVLTLRRLPGCWSCPRGAALRGVARHGDERVDRAGHRGCGATKPVITVRPTSTADVGVVALEYSGQRHCGGRQRRGPGRRVRPRRVRRLRTPWTSRTGWWAGSGTGAGMDVSTSVYSCTGSGDTADIQLTATRTIGERYVALAGGVLLTKRYAATGGDLWAFSNIHGDTLATTDRAGNLNALPAIYDPYGNPLATTTGVVDLTADPTTRTNGLTDGWEGSHQRGAEHTGNANWILMGARVYLPGVGQFTSTDPVFGGNVNPYTYPCDPINHFDLDGRKSRPNPKSVLKWLKTHTVGYCISGAAVAGVGVTGSACVVHSGRHWALALTPGLAMSTQTSAGASILGGPMISNATNPSELRGWFAGGGASGGDSGVGGGADIAVGLGSHGRRIWSVFAGAGFAAGAETHVGASYTYLPWVH